MLIALTQPSCSRKKSTLLSRAYHNTTSRYNGYFNAREIMKQNDRQLQENNVDDYSRLLPLFIYPDEAKSQAMYPDMDKVIEKCSEVIDRHTMYIKKKEHIKWIDDSYLLIGKARFYKQEFGLAEETFLYVYQAYKKNPNRYSGLNWLIRTFIETEQWTKAEDMLDLAEEEFKKYPEELKGDFYAIYADYHLKRDDDRINASQKLEDAIKHTKDKALRRRYTFILAQIYQDDRNYSRATELYGQVLKLNPDYVMRFNAKINRAIAFDVTSNDTEAIKKELNKMLRDKKNEEFRDQIYYALAELALKEDDEPLAVNYLRKSIQYSVNNNMQKALSYYKLADLYFERPDYVKAQEHYDSTIQFLPKDHPDYFDAEEKNKNLQELVQNLKVIILQDSLLALGNMSEKERRKKIEKMIKAKKQEDEKRELARLRALEELQNNQNTSRNFGASTGDSRGKWYFYNPTTIALGTSDFRQVWGDIQLKDNWNRSSAQVIGSKIEEKREELIDPEQARLDSIKNAEKYNPDFYLKDVPTEFNEQLSAHAKIVEALFNVGTIFKESFSDNPSAVKSFKRITAEYDTSRYNLPAHYQLYRIYLSESELDLAEEEKKWILEHHPFSEYAYLIKNPNYNKESKETKQKVEEFYQATYRLFQYQMYADVITSCDRAEQAFSKNHLRPQFAFMKAKAIGHIKDRETFKKELQYVVKEFSKDPVKAKAQEILDYMNKNLGDSNSETKKSSVEYKYDPSEAHMAIFSLSGKETNAFKNQLANFNGQYFREAKLQITSSVLKSNQTLLVRPFSNAGEAVRYLKAAKNNLQLMKAVKELGGQVYLISNNNFRLLFKDKSEELYLNFYNSNYKQD